MAKESALIEYTGDTPVGTGSHDEPIDGHRQAERRRHRGAGLLALGCPPGLTRQVKFTLYASNDSTMTSPKGTCTATLGLATRRQGERHLQRHRPWPPTTTSSSASCPQRVLPAPVENAAITVVRPGPGARRGVAG